MPKKLHINDKVYTIYKTSNKVDPITMEIDPITNIYIETHTKLKTAQKACKEEVERLTKKYQEQYTQVMHQDVPRLNTLDMVDNYSVLIQLPKEQHNLLVKIHVFETPLQK